MVAEQLAADSDYLAQLRVLVDGPYLRSGDLKEQRSAPDRTGAHPAILEFERLFYRRMARIGIPVHASLIVADRPTLFPTAQEVFDVGCGVRMVHSRLGWNLTAVQWGLFGHVGMSMLSSRGRKSPVVWAGLEDPTLWYVVNWEDESHYFPFDPRDEGWRKRVPKGNVQRRHFPPVSKGE